MKCPCLISVKIKIFFFFFCFLIELGFNDMATLVGNFVSSPRESEKRDIRGDEREG